MQCARGRRTTHARMLAIDYRTHSFAAMGLSSGLRRRAKNSCSVAYSSTGFSADSVGILYDCGWSGYR